MKEFLLVSLGSFAGGGLRYLFSKSVQAMLPWAFPLGTMSVNVAGCFIIGLLSAMPWNGGWMNGSTKLLLTTGFCGGFTTFSTFMNEGNAMVRDGQYVSLCLYVFGSLLLGMIAVAGGHWVARSVFTS